MTKQLKHAERYIVFLDTSARHAEKHLQKCIDGLIDQSASVGVLLKKNDNLKTCQQLHRPDIQLIKQYQDMISIIGNPRWPSDWHRSCILVGSSTQTIESIDIFFLSDCNPNHLLGDFDQFCERILAAYDWAFFQYFTTYLGHVMAFIARDKAVHDWLILQNHLVVRDDYHDAPVGLASLRTATFYDYDEQRLLPILLAEERNEPLPLALCCIEKDSEQYQIYCEEKEDYLSGSAWYQEHLKKLPIVAQWIQKEEHGVFQYLLLKITDLDAFCSLNRGVNEGGGVISHVVSGLYDLEKLKQEWADNRLDQMVNLSQWAMSAYYGGGADEHHGIFYAKDSQVTHEIWQMLGLNRQREMQMRLHSDGFMVDGDEWSLSFLLESLVKRNNTEKSKLANPSLLLCQFDPKGEYRIWCSELFEYLDVIWYEEDLAKLDVVAEFSAHQYQYKVLVIDDMDAFLSLWQQNDGNNGIARAIFAADCDMAMLEECLLASEHAWAYPENMTDVSSWLYAKGRDVSCRDFRYFYAQNLNDAQAFYQRKLATVEGMKNVQISRF